MSLFKENPNKILNLLNEISDERRQILFGDSERFKNWLKKHEITDKVSI